MAPGSARRLPWARSGYSRKTGRESGGTRGTSLRVAAGPEAGAARRTEGKKEAAAAALAPKASLGKHDGVSHEPRVVRKLLSSPGRLEQAAGLDNAFKLKDDI